MSAILTFADSKFYRLVQAFARQLETFPGYKLFVYDLGLRENQKASLRALGVTIEVTDVPGDSFVDNSQNNIRAAHKMYCIQDFQTKYGQSVVVMDADTFIIERIDEIWPTDSRQIVVTNRCPRERKPHILENGKINAGLMAFGQAVPESFFQQWKDLCSNPEHTDQSSLSEMLEAENIDFDLLDTPQPFMDFTAVVRDGTIYNDVTCRTGKVFHFKSVGRRWSKKFFYVLFTRFAILFPAFVRRAVALNRHHGILVWKAK